MFVSEKQSKAFFRLLDSEIIDPKNLCQIIDLFETSNIPLSEIFEITIKYNNLKLLECIKNFDLMTLYELSSKLADSPVMMSIKYNNIPMYISMINLFPLCIIRCFDKAIETSSNNFICFLIDRIEPNDMKIVILIKMLRNNDIHVCVIEKFFRKLELNNNITNIKKNCDISNYVIKNKMAYLLDLLIELKYSFDKKVVMTAFETNDIIILEKIIKKVVKENLDVYDFVLDTSAINQDMLIVLKSYGYIIY